MTKREQLIQVIVADKAYKTICQKVNWQAADDIFQEVCYVILTIAAEKLPDISYLKFWFYRTAANVMTANGSLGIALGKDVPTGMQTTGKVHGIANDAICFHKASKTGAKYIPNPAKDSSNEPAAESKLRKAEKCLLAASEKENRLMVLLGQTGNMKEVSRRTGVKVNKIAEIKNRMQL